MSPRGQLDTVQALRALGLRGVVHGVDDTGADQMLTVEHHYGHTRSQVPVYQPFGFSSHAPHDGAVAVLLAVGGDHADLIAMCARNPSVARFGNLGEGESVVYDSVGQRLHFRSGTLVEIHAKSELKVSIDGQQVFDLTAQQATFDVPVVANQGVSTPKDVTAGSVSLRGHKHTDVKAGTDTSGAPVGG